MPKVAERAAVLSVVVTALLAVAELSVGVYSGALSVIANGVQSAIDLLAAVTAWVAVRQAAKPPDAEHRYGHGKVESLLAAVQALLIWLTCGLIAYEAIKKWQGGGAVTHPPAAIAVMALSATVGWLTARYLFAVAHRTQSLALQADAWHLQADAGAALSVLVGLTVLALTGWQFLDALLALGVAAVIAKSGFELLQQATHHLLDTALPPDEEAAIQSVLRAHAERFINAHRLRTRRAGNRRYVDLHLVVPDAMTVAEAHHLCDAIEGAIRRILPGTDVTIHVEPESAFLRQGEEDRVSPIIHSGGQ